MATPWQKLKELETAAFSARRAGTLDRQMVSRLRRAFRAIEALPDAACAIVYHSALALLHEFDGCMADAIRHRSIEVAKIRRLHASVRRHPGNKPALRGVGRRYLASRERALAQMRKAVNSTRRV